VKIPLAKLFIREEEIWKVLNVLKTPVLVWANYEEFEGLVS
jgi:hypothetical protein